MIAYTVTGEIVDGDLFCILVILGIFILLNTVPEGRRNTLTKIITIVRSEMSRSRPTM